MAAQTFVDQQLGSECTVILHGRALRCILDGYDANSGVGNVSRLTCRYIVLGDVEIDAEQQRQIAAVVETARVSRGIDLNHD